MAILADAHPRLATIPDDRGVVFVGEASWMALVNGAPLTPQIAADLAAATGFDEVVLIDIRRLNFLSSALSTEGIPPGALSRPDCQ